jgi:hypothetical protein
MSKLHAHYLDKLAGVAKIVTGEAREEMVLYLELWAARKYTTQNKRGTLGTA